MVDHLPRTIKDLTSLTNISIFVVIIKCLIQQLHTNSINLAKNSQKKII